MTSFLEGEKMRRLTLNEKINLKGIISRQYRASMVQRCSQVGMSEIIVPLALLDMSAAVFHWQVIYGYVPISQYHKFMHRR